MPDIDTDFCYEKRQQVLDYIINRYGQEKVVRLLEQIPDLENNYLIVYGDSKGDSQLLKYANESHYRAL